jgi:hypothetical protein
MLLISFALLLGCAASGPKRINADNRLWLRNDDAGPFDVYYYSKGEVLQSGVIQDLVNHSGNDSDYAGIILIKAQEWKKDHGRFEISRVVTIGAEKREIIDDMNGPNFTAQHSTFIDQGDWVDKYYEMKVRPGQDSVYVRIYGNVTGFFGLDKKAEYRPLYMIYPTRTR